MPSGRMRSSRIALRLLPWFALIGGTAAALEPAVRGFLVTADDIAGRLRVFAERGDYGIRNAAVTAMIHRRDGVLVDFWRNAPTPSTIPQLHGADSVDGLWAYSIAVQSGDLSAEHPHEVVESNGPEVVVSGPVFFGSSRLRVETTYRLIGERAALEIESTLEHTKGADSIEAAFVDTVRWGNVDYFAEGVGRLPNTFDGTVAWVGRKGAGGDLMLSASTGSSLHVAFTTAHPGFQGPVRVAHLPFSLAPGQSKTVRRMLHYDHIVDSKPTGGAAGSVTVRITDELDRPLPAKLSFRGIDGTLDPDFGNDGDEHGANRFVWSGNGAFQRELAAGRYEVLATSGIERDAARWTVDVAPDRDTRLEGKLPRVVTTPGQIAGDLHLHQVPSVDADIGFATRVVSIVAEGIEFAVATDHYVVTDLEPTVRSLRRQNELSRHLVTAMGTEVSTTSHRFGHFNVFPLDLDAKIESDSTTPRALMAGMRRASPDGLIQVNHPRWNDIGYFQRLEMDPRTAEIPERFRDEYSPAFDAIEIYNGLDVGNERGVMDVFRDYLHLLEKGHRYAATGNSDSHKLFFVDPGIPHNLIHWGNAKTDDEDLAADPDLVVSAIRQGRLTVTSGPILDVAVGEAGPGETAKVAGTRVSLSVRVRAAPWVDVSAVEVYVGARGTPIVRSVPKSRSIVRFDDAITFAASKPTFVTVRARGDVPLPHVFSRNAMPMAFSNPIWIEPGAR